MPSVVGDVLGVGGAVNPCLCLNQQRTAVPGRPQSVLNVLDSGVRRAVDQQVGMRLPNCQNSNSGSLHLLILRSDLHCIPLTTVPVLRAAFAVILLVQSTPNEDAR
jgi:hypothetical protein